jgi:hypothetical protein
MARELRCRCVCVQGVDAAAERRLRPAGPANGGGRPTASGDSSKPHSGVSFLSFGYVQTECLLQSVLRTHRVDLRPHFSSSWLSWVHSQRNALPPVRRLSGPLMVQRDSDKQPRPSSPVQSAGATGTTGGAPTVPPAAATAAAATARRHDSESVAPSSVKPEAVAPSSVKPDGDAGTPSVPLQRKPPSASVQRGPSRRRDAAW